MLDFLAVPDLLSAKQLLVVQPHYDDNDIAAGGTLARLAARGTRITYVTVTDDLIGVADPDLTDAEASARMWAEQDRAGSIVGVSEQIRLDYPDAGRWDHHDLRDDLIRIIRVARPDVVLTCDPWLAYEAHRDHIRCGHAVAEAVMLQDAVRLRTTPEVDAAYEPYEVSALALYWSAAANTTVDIGGHREAKHQAIDCYETQITPPARQVLHWALEQQERAWAEGETFEHAERFKVLHPRHLHCFTGAAAL